MKPGWKTTEFWLTLATAVWTSTQSAAPPAVKAVVGGVLAVAYAISRGLAKSNAASPTDDAP